MRAIAISRSWIKDAAVGIGASLIVALCAPIAICLPFTPIPVVIQLQVILLLSAILGPRRGVWMVSAFLMQGAMGLPVFAAGASTIGTLIGPRGGYLAGYLIAAYVVGRLYQKNNLFLSMIAGNGVVYICGFAWLSQFIGMERAFQLGIVPFILGDFIKVTLFALPQRFWNRVGALV